jgi:hypothetical protein
MAQKSNTIFLQHVLSQLGINDIGLEAFSGCCLHSPTASITIKTISTSRLGCGSWVCFAMSVLDNYVLMIKVY